VTLYHHVWWTNQPIGDGIELFSMPHLDLGGCWAGPLGFPVRRSGELSHVVHAGSAA
jgi:hypothetical protein